MLTRSLIWEITESAGFLEVRLLTIKHDIMAKQRGGCSPERYSDPSRKVTLQRGQYTNS